MAMNDDVVLERATQALRRHTDTGWILVRENVLLKALSAFRPSAPVRGRTTTTTGVVEFFVAADVLVATLREAIATVAGAAPLTITCSTDEQDRITRVTIEVLAAFDEPLLVLAAEVRRVAGSRLVAVLGDLAPREDAVDVDVAITDVTDAPL
jgi:hypothetical protein